MVCFGSEAGCYFDINICFKSWFGGAVRKVTLKIMLDFMSSVFSETSGSNTFSFQGKNFFFLVAFSAASDRKIRSELFFSHPFVSIAIKDSAIRKE